MEEKAVVFLVGGSSRCPRFLAANAYQKSVATVKAATREKSHV